MRKEFLAKLKVQKKIYYKKEIDKMKDSDRARWYSNLKKLTRMEEFKEMNL